MQAERGSSRREGFVSKELCAEARRTVANSLDSLPKRVHSFIKQTSVLVEFVREYKVVGESVEASPSESGSGSVFVDQAAEGGYIRYLFRDVCYVRHLL